MSFTEPLSITISAVTTPLPRTNVEGRLSEYTSADGSLKVTASHVVAKRARRMLRLDLTKLAPSPFDDTKNVTVSSAMYIVFDAPIDGFTNAELLAAFTGFRAMMAASSDAMISKLLGGES